MALITSTKKIITYIAELRTAIVVLITILNEKDVLTEKEFNKVFNTMKSRY